MRNEIALIAAAIISVWPAAARCTAVQVTIHNNDGADDVYVKVIDLNASPNMVVFPDPASGSVCAPLVHGGMGVPGTSATFNATTLADGKYNLAWITVDTTKQQTKSGVCNDDPGDACQVDLFSPSPVDPQSAPCP